MGTHLEMYADAGTQLIDTDIQTAYALKLHARNAKRSCIQPVKHDIIAPQ